VTSLLRANALIHEPLELPGRYKSPNQIERFFGRIKQFRRVATHYEKTLQNFAGFIWLAVLMINVL
jgi:transposase